MQVHLGEFDERMQWGKGEAMPHVARQIVDFEGLFQGLSGIELDCTAILSKFCHSSHLNDQL